MEIYGDFDNSSRDGTDVCILVTISQIELGLSFFVSRLFLISEIFSTFASLINIVSSLQDYYYWKRNWWLV